ncbi:Glutamate-1-semialdehyde 2,1-aminomutase [Gossypium arboreum]|uniref:Glutamate-1-semialdehyde 2,1-aminomutase n=1 Tax=Gossypium arboreum TaxID=29729 RepID=A0A0B0NW03_GOSAR|nr:Glutamate-1-semialdehyde 2,1-aminomutase [Gossypium arboreum]
MKRVRDTSLIFLRCNGADRKRRILSPCIGNRAYLSPEPYLPEQGSKLKIEDLISLSSSGADRKSGAGSKYKSYLPVVARKQTKEDLISLSSSGADRRW